MLILLALAAAEAAAPEDVGANFQAMLKQLGGMHRYIEQEESAKAVLEKQRATAEQQADVARAESAQLKTQLATLRGNFGKVEQSWVKTAVELTRERKQVEAKTAETSQLEAENARL